MIALSTTLCQIPQAPNSIFQSWQARNRGAPWLAIDPRLPGPVQNDLLEIAHRAGTFCCELAHPRRLPNKRPTASLSSLDSHERREAIQQLCLTVETAAKFLVPRIVLYPSLFPLKIDIETLRYCYAIEKSIDTQLLMNHRRFLAERAFDGLCQTLDRVLQKTSAYTLEFCFVVPSMYPHHFPSVGEVNRLLREFKGAPLGAIYATDWAHAKNVLSLNEYDEALDTTPTALRIADACGLTLRLPLGCGEVSWSPVWNTLNKIPSLQKAVLVLETDATNDEISSSIDFLEKESAIVTNASSEAR